MPARATLLLVPALVVAVLGTLACGACVARPKPLPQIVPSNVFLMPERALCEGRIGRPEAVATLGEPALIEVSGVVTSPRHPGVMWMHNDSGDSARVFAIATDGTALGELSLPGVEAVDFEDIAAGPCPDLSAPCIYVADVGDNRLARPNIAVYAFPEPDVSLDSPLPDGARAETVWRFPLEIPEEAGGRANIEAFVVLPDASAMIFYEKKAGEARILRYRAPWQIDAFASLELAGVFATPGPNIDGGGLVTAADLHPSGKRLVMRTYLGVFEARLDPDSGRTADSVTGEEFVQLFLGPGGEPQGEAVTYDEEGTGLFTVSESRDAPNQPLHHAACN
jgi:hypothetical protein